MNLHGDLVGGSPSSGSIGWRAAVAVMAGVQNQVGKDLVEAIGVPRSGDVASDLVRDRPARMRELELTDHCRASRARSAG